MADFVGKPPFGGNDEERSGAHVFEGRHESRGTVCLRWTLRATCGTREAQWTLLQGSGGRFGAMWDCWFGGPGAKLKIVNFEGLAHGHPGWGVQKSFLVPSLYDPDKLKSRLWDDLAKLEK